jgi:CRISPR/Cas system endoribonuclease Cas6 (RAMP superfamily)
MRLLVKLLCVESSQYEMQYHYHLQSFIYNLLRDSNYHSLHNKEGYKFFTITTELVKIIRMNMRSYAYKQTAITL